MSAPSTCVSWFISPGVAVLPRRGVRGAPWGSRVGEDGAGAFVDLIQRDQARLAAGETLVHGAGDLRGRAGEVPDADVVNLAAEEILRGGFGATRPMRSGALALGR